MNPRLVWAGAIVGTLSMLVAGGCSSSSGGGGGGSSSSGGSSGSSSGGSSSGSSSGGSSGSSSGSASDSGSTTDSGGSSSGGGSGSSSGNGCKPDPAEVPPTCTGLAGVCKENGAGGVNACIEYYGANAAMQGSSNCPSPKVWYPGMSCKDVEPNAEMIGACQIGVAGGLCLIEYKNPSSFCFNCTSTCYNATCVSVP